MATKGLIFKFGADMTQFRTAMDNSAKSIAKMGKKMQGLGKTMSTYVTAPIVALGAASVLAWDKQAKAIAQVEQGLRTTGGAVGYTSEQLQKMASELQANSLFGDEEILKNATSQLLTFTNIAGEQFARTQQAALDLSTRLDGDLKSASIQLGKALNDPVANLSALSRSGIQFSEDQKAMIKSLAETNHLADAQTLILNELEKQYGGSAEAAASAGLGPMKQLSNSIGDLTEDFGKIITTALNPFIKKIGGLVEWFKNLSDSTKKWIVIIGGIAAAIGPFIFALGTIMQLAPIVASGLSAIAVAFNAINWPLVAIIAGIAAFVAAGIYMWDNWEAITQNMTKAWVATKNFLIDGIIAIVEGITWFSRTVLEALGFDVLSDGVDFIVEKLESLKDPLPEVTAEFGTFGESVSAAMDAVFGSTEKTTSATESLGDASATTSTNMAKMGSASRKAIEALPEMTTKAATGVAELNFESEKLNITMQNVGNSAMKTFESFGQKLQETSAKVATFASYAQEAFGIMFSTISGFMDNKMQKERNNAAESINRINRLVAADVMTAQQGEAAKYRIQQESYQRQADLKRKAFKAEKTAALIMIAINTALSISKTFAQLGWPAGIAGAAIALAAGIAQAAVVSSKPVPAFADGGLVFGPTMGLVGEGIGTTRSNPEVIAPLDKLKGMMNTAVNDTINVIGRIRGEDIYLSNQKSQLAYANLQV